MSAPAFDHAAFDARLVALGILSAELAQIIGCDVAAIDKWRAGRAKPDADARVLLRVLDDDHRATLAVERVRDGFTQSLGGDGVRRAGIEPPPYSSGHQGTTGGQPV